VEDVKDVDLYKMVPFNCELPGTSRLQVSLFDYDMIGGDGRCFVQRWLLRVSKWVALYVVSSVLRI
jgi:hypothetical protein